MRSAEEVQRRKELDASHQQLEFQKKYLEEIREEQEQARKRAEDEIRQVDDCIHYSGRCMQNKQATDSTDRSIQRSIDWSVDRASIDRR